LRGPVDERDRQAPGRLGAERDALDQGPCPGALPQAGAREPAGGRGRDRRDVALRRKKTRKLWIWKALERATGRLIAWECGDRDAPTLERLLGRVEPRGVRLFCTDDWPAYDAALPAGRRYVGKDQTQRSESNNARQRHWIAVDRAAINPAPDPRGLQVYGHGRRHHGAVRPPPLQRWQPHARVSRVKPSRRQPAWLPPFTGPRPPTRIRCSRYLVSWQRASFAGDCR